MMVVTVFPAMKSESTEKADNEIKSGFFFVFLTFSSGESEKLFLGDEIFPRRTFPR